MYQSYLLRIQAINKDNILQSSFKSDSQYQFVLEHVSREQGQQYLQLIQTEFNTMSQDAVCEYVAKNDACGQPVTYSYLFDNGKNITCSPTSLRYVYHALVILSHLKETGNTSIVEVGCGYGGLYLAICYFAKILGIRIQHYAFIDFPEVCSLINAYVSAAIDTERIPYSVHSCHTYGADISSKDLFLISNYCFTEIEDKHREGYISELFNKVTHGFIIWQTVFGVPVQHVSSIQKSILRIETEKPQTATTEPNFFVYF